MTRRSLLIAGSHSGAGKTTVALALMAALTQRGLKVQPFKVGPDFIDPGHHTAVCGRVSRNLDTWMLPEAVVCATFDHASQDCDVAVIEGVMGLFDGRGPDDLRGSTADIARLLEVPVVLVVDAGAMAGSIAALVKGFAEFDPGVRIVGVVCNRVAGPRHYEYLETALLRHTSVVPLGWLPRRLEWTVPERHLGLTTAEDLGNDRSRWERLGESLPETVDLERLLELSWVGPARRAGPLPQVRLAEPDLPRTLMGVGLATDESSPPAILVSGLCYAYAAGPLALDAIRFEVARGERVGLVGPNGAGKTTLFLCLTGVLKGQAGAVRLMDLDPADPAQRRQLPARVGIVFQDSDDQIFNTTVFDDVAFGPLNLGLPVEEVRRRVAESLERVGLSALGQRVPFHLSGGEKRRVAIAGILAALASTTLTGLRRQARASGEARLIVYRLQSARTLAVSQGWPQGYYFGGTQVANAFMDNLPWCLQVGCGFAFKATSATAPATYAPNLGQEELPVDTVPYISSAGGPVQALSVTALNVGQANFTVGFDLNGLPNINPAPNPMAWPICIGVQDVTDATTLRWVIVFSDGTTRIQQANETYCV